MNKPKGQIIREQATTYIVPAGTLVEVEDSRTKVLEKHTTRNENRFRSGSMVYADQKHYTFSTGNPDWPYMVVPKSVFQSNVLANRPPALVGSPCKMPKLTERAKKQILDHGRCPDCGAKKWLSGPCGGGSQNVKCDVCGMCFNVGPFFAERI